jgi:hypothetical protein
LAAWLKKENRVAMLTEVGAGNNADCADKWVLASMGCRHVLAGTDLNRLGTSLNYLKTNPDVFQGFTVWAVSDRIHFKRHTTDSKQAGSFATDYTLSVTPTKDSSGAFKDNDLWINAVQPNLPGYVLAYKWCQGVLTTL